MTVSTATFKDRLKRLDRSTVTLYAGDETPQKYKRTHLRIAKPTPKKPAGLVIFLGALLGLFTGYMFEINVGIDLFFSQPLTVAYTIIKADYMTAGICLAMLVGPVCAIGSKLISRTENRFVQFWWSYLVGSFGVNLTVWYFFYLSSTA